MSEVLVERRGRVAIVTLNRPESLNGFTTGLRNALRKELQAVATSCSRVPAAASARVPT
jgi:enoyl-CoA hydratase/carnithine racemase